MKTDKYQGQSGTYIVKDGERVPVSPDAEGMVTIGEQQLHRPQTKPHPEGDAPRNEKNERVDRGADQQEAAKPQPAMPLPAASAPWATPEAAPAATAAGRTTKSKGDK